MQKIVGLSWCQKPAVFAVLMFLALYCKYRQHWVVFEPTRLRGDGRPQAIAPDDIPHDFTRKLLLVLSADGVHFRTNKQGDIFVHHYKAADRVWRTDCTRRALTASTASRE